MISCKKLQRVKNYNEPCGSLTIICLKSLLSRWSGGLRNCLNRLNKLFNSDFRGSVIFYTATHPLLQVGGVRSGYYGEPVETQGEDR